MNFLLIIQLFVSLALITVIVLQAKGTGLGRSFGTTSYHAKRGIEKTLFYGTIALAFIFVMLAMFISF